jgi:hypothetical protein
MRNFISWDINPCSPEKVLHSSRLLSKNVKVRINKNYNFACGSVWVWNSVSDIKGWTQTEGVWEQCVEENIWTEEKWSDRRLEKTA